jgi:hypothetical protein
MPFTAACLQETLRKYSIVPVLVRVATRDTKLLGHFIPKGTKCSIMVGSTHRMWKDPEVYRPERFLPGGEFENFPEDVRRCGSRHHAQPVLSVQNARCSGCLVSGTGFQWLLLWSCCGFNVLVTEGVLQIHVCALWAGPPGLHRTALFSHGITSRIGQDASALQVHFAEAIPAGVAPQPHPITASGWRANHCIKPCVGQHG